MLMLDKQSTNWYILPLGYSNSTQPGRRRSSYALGIQFCILYFSRATFNQWLYSTDASPCLSNVYASKCPVSISTAYGKWYVKSMEEKYAGPRDRVFSFDSVSSINIGPSASPAASRKTQAQSVQVSSTSDNASTSDTQSTDVLLS
uniref:Uncharacterized protein n=1 Tax=Panagrolaimus davidi TaxID=227884 RepID=A0A914PNM8_9BILA